MIKTGKIGTILVIIWLSASCFGCIEEPVSNQTASPSAASITSPSPALTPISTPTPTPTLTPTPSAESIPTPSPTSAPSPQKMTINFTFTYPIFKETSYDVSPEEAEETKKFFDNFEEVVENLDNAESLDMNGSSSDRSASDTYSSCTPGKWTSCWDSCIEEETNAVEYLRRAKEEVAGAKKILNKISSNPPSIEYHRICYRYMDVCDGYLELVDYRITAYQHFVDAFQAYKIGTSVYMYQGETFISKGNEYIEQYNQREGEYNKKIEELVTLIEALPDKQSASNGFSAI